MKTVFITILLGMGFASSALAMPAFDGDFQCTTATKADQYVRDFQVDTSSFGGRELCNGNTDFKKLMNDFDIIENGHFATNTANNLIRGFIDSGKYYSWMKGETRGMNRGNDVPYATAYNSWGYFTMQDGWAKLSTLGRVGTVIHEARHTAGYRHISCTQGPYAGANLAGCDTTYEYGGSHAIEMEYYARVVVQGDNFHPLYKKMARLMALGRSNFTFNRPVLKAREALILVKSDRSEAVLVDGQNISLREIRGNGVLKRTSFGASLFDVTGAWALDPYQNYQNPEAVKDDYSYFKLLMGARGLPSGTRLRDFEEVDLNNKRYVVAIDDQGNVGTYNFPNGGWNQFQSLGVNANSIKTRTQGSNLGVFIRDTANDTFQFDPNNGRLSRKISSWNSDIQSVLLSSSGKELFLLATGQLVNSQDRTPFIEGNYSEGVNIPMYDAFEVQ